MRTRRRLALLLVFALLLTSLAGCEKTDANSVAEESVYGNADESGPDGNIVLGRYVEEVIDLPGKIDGYGCNLHRLSDGRIVISDRYRPFLISDDNGETWKEDDREWHSKMLREGSFATEIAIGADNTAAVIYNDGTYDKEKHRYTGNPRLLVVRPDGTENLIDIPAGQGSQYPYKVAVADNGIVFVSVTDGSALYEVKEDGSCEYYMTVQGDRPEWIQFHGKLMFLDGVGYPYPLIYDMEKKEYVEDEVLAGFVKDNYPGSNSYNGSGTYQMYFFSGEEGVIYIAGKKGLHRHVLGGSVMEQIIDGHLCTFNNPSYEIVAMIMLADNTFLALFDGEDSGRLVSYAYDADVAAVSAHMFKVYSLKENDTIRQAISLFQTKYPDITVEYEIGMEEGSFVTREDALKSLNTKIMAGEGPDVLVLDDMPLDSYMERGVLMELGTSLDSLNGEEAVFDSILQAMKKDDKIYAMPCEIQLPVMMGAEKYISQGQGLERIADMMEEARRDLPGKDLLGICTEKGIMRYFAISCVPAWTTQGGELDTEAVAQFLIQTKRIYDAQMDGLAGEVIEQYQRINDAWLRNHDESKDDSEALRTDNSIINYAGESVQLFRTALSSTSVYDEMISVSQAEGFEGSKWTVMNGQGGNVFCARTLLGISAASKNAEPAKDFIRLCLGKENQSKLFYGLPVNKAAFDADFVVADNTERYLWLGNNADGLEIRINIYPSEEEQIADLKNCVEAVDTPYIENTVLENVVYDEGIRYMQGAQSLEEAVEAIEQKLWIYMAE